MRFVKLIMLYKSSPCSVPWRITVLLQPLLPDRPASSAALPRRGRTPPPRSTALREPQTDTFFWVPSWHSAIYLDFTLAYVSDNATSIMWKVPKIIFFLDVAKKSQCDFSLFEVQCHTQRQAVLTALDFRQLVWRLKDNFVNKRWTLTQLFNFSSIY